MSYEIRDKQLFIGAKHIELPEDFYPEQVCSFKDKLIVRCRSSLRQSPDDNVVAFDLSGNFLWRIQPYSFEHQQNPYSNIVPEGEQLVIYCWAGLYLYIDPETGKILGQKPGRPW